MSENLCDAANVSDRFDLGANKRAGRGEKLWVESLIDPRVLMEIIQQTDPTDQQAETAAVRRVFNCFNTNSFQLYNEDVRNTIIAAILQLLSTNPQAAKFGLDLFIAIFCTSRKEIIGPTIGAAILEQLSKFFAPGQDQLLLFLSLNIAIQLSGESYESSRMVAKVLTPELICHIIMEPGLNMKCRRSGLIVLGNVIAAVESLTNEDAQLVTTLISNLIDGYTETREYAHFLQEAVYCATVFIETYVRWQVFIESSDLVPKLNMLLTKKHTGLKVMILKFATAVFAGFRCGSGGFDIQLIINHITHDIAAIQVGAVRCLSRLAEQSAFMRQNLIANGIIPKITTCLESGAFKAKVDCVRLLIELSRDNNPQILAQFVDSNVFEALLSLIPIVPERPCLSILHLLINSTEVSRKAGLEEQFIQHLNSINAFDALIVCCDNPNTLIADNAQSLIDELGLL